MRFHTFFQGENGLFRVLSLLTDLVGLSVCWLFLSLPLVTLGAASSALYFAVVKCYRQGERKPYLLFWRSFRENFKTGTAATLLAALPAALLFLGWDIMRFAAGEGYAALYGAYCVALLLPGGVFCVLFPLLGRFTFRVGALYATALKLTLRHLPSAVVVALLTAEVISATLRHLWPVLFAPAVTALLVSLFFERIFLRYAPPER